jgi:hypothetical protein
MAMSDAKFIEACIPDSLRLAEHQDAALVNEAIATTLMAYRKALRDNVWEKNIAADINRAMTAYMEGTYVPHISKENEDWSKLQLEAEEARVMKAAQAEVARPVEAMPETPTEPVMEPVVTGDNVVTITSFKKARDSKNLDAGWTFTYSGAASGTGSVGHGIDVFGQGIYVCEVNDSSGNLIARKQGEFAGAALRKAFKKAGYKLSELPRFAEDSDAKAKGQSSTSIESRIAKEAEAPIGEE